MSGTATDRPGLDRTAPAWRLAWIDVFWIAILLLVGALLWLPGLGTRGLWTSGEARAGQVARHMVATGDYVTMRQQMNEPHLTVVGTEGRDAVTYDPGGKVVVYDHGWRQDVWTEISRGTRLRPEVEYRPLITIHKPVFYYWLIAVAHRLGMDVNSFTLRCFSAVPAMMLLGVTYLLGCALYGRRVGIVAAFALATCVQFWWQARICQMDMLLALLMTTALLCWFVGDRSDRRGVRLGCFLAVYVLLAAATLLKSFAYMLLAGLIVLVFLAVETVFEHPRRRRLRAYGRRIRDSMKRMHFAVGLVLYLLLVVPWFVMIHLRTDGQFTRTIFLHHMFSRAGLLDVGREFEKKTHVGFYFVRMMVDLFPWVIMLPGAVVQVFRARCRDTWRSGAYLLTWIVVWLAFFSAMRYRKNEYILPMYPAAMVLAAKMLVDFVRDQATDIHLGRAIRLAFIGLAIGVTAAGTFALALLNRRFFEWAIPKLGTNKNDEAALRALADLLHAHLPVAVGVLLVLVGGIALAAVLVHLQRTGVALGLLTAGAAVVMLFATHVLMDRIIDPRRSQRTFAAALEENARELAPGTRLILFATEQHELVYLMPDRFDSVPGVRNASGLNKLFALKSRLAAAETSTFVVMEERFWDLITGTMRLQEIHDPYIDRLEPVPLPNGDDYIQDHREPLVLLRYRPDESRTTGAAGAE